MGDFRGDIMAYAPQLRRGGVLVLMIGLGLSTESQQAKFAKVQSERATLERRLAHIQHKIALENFTDSFLHSVTTNSVGMFNMYGYHHLQATPSNMHGFNWLKRELSSTSAGAISKAVHVQSKVWTSSLGKCVYKVGWSPISGGGGYDKKKKKRGAFILYDKVACALHAKPADHSSRKRCPAAIEYKPFNHVHWWWCTNKLKSSSCAHVAKHLHVMTRDQTTNELDSSAVNGCII